MLILAPPVDESGLSTTAQCLKVVDAFALETSEKETQGTAVCRMHSDEVM